jgi:hypothetical protein
MLVAKTIMLAIKYEGLLAMDRIVVTSEGGIESIAFFISDKPGRSSNISAARFSMPGCRSPQWIRTSLSIGSTCTSSSHHLGSSSSTNGPSEAYAFPFGVEARRSRMQVP